MSWSDKHNLEHTYNDPEFIKNFTNYFSLSQIVKHGIFPTNYMTPDKLDDCIYLSDTGQAYFDYLKKEINEINDSDIKLALFIILYHHDLLIDLKKSNYDMLINIFHKEIFNRNIIYPWIYEKTLNERYYTILKEQKFELSYDETSKLLENTPKGLFQIENILIGPYGILKSKENRLIPPTRSVIINFCTHDCKGHKVSFKNGDNKITKIMYTFFRHPSIYNNPESEWFSYYFDKITPNWYRDLRTDLLPILLAEAFSENELRLILKSQLDANYDDIRNNFPETKYYNNLFNNTTEKVVKKLSKSECLHISLLQTDNEIVQIIEELIDEHKINIPPTEVRRPVIKYGEGGWLYSNCECSKYGIRSYTTSFSGIAINRLKRLINYIYDKGARKSLEWKLRYIPGKNVNDKLSNYIYLVDPKIIIKEVVIDSPDNIIKCFRFLKFGSFSTPSSPEEEEVLIEKVLWKLGFDIKLYPNYQKIFWERLEKFKKITVNYSTTNEKDREQIRNVGVNFFVSLEQLLYYSLSFTTWTLLSDHYIDTKFKCNFDQTKSFMYEVLNNQKYGNDILKYSKEGKNTLSPLIYGFDALSKICSKFLKNKSKYLRKSSDCAGYHNKTEIEQFPFIHKIMLLDIKREDAENIINILHDITMTLEKAKVANVRNGIDHYRDDDTQIGDFPKKDEIDIACNAISDIINNLEKLGICPAIYNFAGMSIDEYGRGYKLFKNYKGTEIKISIPLHYRLTGMHIPDNSQLIIPCLNLIESSDMLRFEYIEISEFADVWRGYPKYKTKDTENSIDIECGN